WPGGSLPESAFGFGASAGFAGPSAGAPSFFASASPDPPPASGARSPCATTTSMRSFVSSPRVGLAPFGLAISSASSSAGDRHVVVLGGLLLAGPELPAFLRRRRGDLGALLRAGRRRGDLARPLLRGRRGGLAVVVPVLALLLADERLLVEPPHGLADRPVLL